MIQEYFIYNGQKYNAGTVIFIKRFNVYSRSLYNAKAIFQYYNVDNKTYAIQIDNKTEFCSEENFNRDFCGVYGEIKNHNNGYTSPKQCTFKNELEIDGLFLAWIWYVFIMVIALIFNDRIAIWILTSVIFFNYRNKKLKECGYK